ncbi:hypothetical protein HJD18_13445 [Thermoleophilia bacterium SCSIO 60948]|nr:hypothetical protein HJD18_13445 [Thermoleophilia bacterium SCSIO 60948]
MHCAQCLAPVGDRLGYETPSEEILCGPCYFALWGPRGRNALSERARERRPASRRPRLGSVRQPGPTGEPDPGVSTKLDRFWDRRRRG